MTARKRYILYFKTPADAQKVYDQIFMNGCYDASEDDYDCDTIYITCQCNANDSKHKYTL